LDKALTDVQKHTTDIQQLEAEKKHLTDAITSSAIREDKIRTQLDIAKERFEEQQATILSLSHVRNENVRQRKAPERLRPFGTQLNSLTTIREQSGEFDDVQESRQNNTTRTPEVVQDDPPRIIRQVKSLQEYEPLY